MFPSTCGPLQVDGHLVTGIHKPVDLYRLTAIFGPAVKILPNLSQPVDLYRLTSTFRIYQKVSKTVETLTGWRTVGFKFLLFFSTCRPMQVDGQFSTKKSNQSFWRQSTLLGSVQVLYKHRGEGVWQKILIVIMWYGGAGSRGKSLCISSYPPENGM